MSQDRPSTLPEFTPKWWRRRWVKLTVAAVVLALFVIAGWEYLGELRRLREASPVTIGAMVLSLLAVRVVQGATFKVLLARLGHRVGLGEMFLLNILMSYTNLLVPRAGLGTPAVYLKYRHKVSYAKFSSLSLLVIVLHTTMSGLLGLACLGIARFGFDRPADLKVCVLFAFVVAGGIACTSLRPPIGWRWQGRLPDFVRRLRDSWEHLGSNRKTILQVLSLRLTMLILYAVRLKLAFVAIGAEVTFTGVFVATVLGTLALLVSVTPSGLGFREAAVAYSATMLGCSPPVALSAAVLDRLVMVLCVVVMAQFGLWRLGGTRGQGVDLSESREEAEGAVENRDRTDPLDII